MENKQEESAEYSLLSNAVEGQPIAPFGGTRSSCSEYPGSRRSAALSGGPPLYTVLIKTGGNALQAVQHSVLENAHNDLMAVSVPCNVEAGSTLLVATPDGRVVETAVPPGAMPGHTFLVQIPPVEGPSDFGVTGRDFLTGTEIVQGHDIEHTDLHLRVVVSSSSSGEVEMTHGTENQLPSATNTTPTGYTNSRDDDDEVVRIRGPPRVAPGSAE
jgi:hypothetical protein